MVSLKGPIDTFATAPSGDTSPDSVAKIGDKTFVVYANGADSTGADGSSDIVEYNASGAPVANYTIAGSVDGLKYDSGNGLLYALQNQDGNSTLTLIDPRTGQVSAPMPYAQTSSSRGYDDIVFKGHQVFESYTNPTGNGDPVIVQLRHGNDPFGALQTTPVLASDATGLNTVTGQRNQTVPLTDPDSLKLAPNGDLLLSSGADGVVVDVHNPGLSDQSVRFTQVTDASGNAASGLDDVIKPSSTSGTFKLTNTSGNDVLSFHLKNLNPNDYYASVESLGGFGQIDPKTGVFKLLVPASGSHGVSFTPGPAAEGNFAYAPAPHQVSSDAGTQLGSMSGVSHAVANLAQAIHDGAGSAAGNFSHAGGQDPATSGDIAAPALDHHAHGTKLFG